MLLDFPPTPTPTCQHHPLIATSRPMLLDLCQSLSSHIPWYFQFLAQYIHEGILVYSFRDRMGTLTEALERYLRGKANVCVLLDTELTCLQL